jgi:hypothetical protein
MSKREKVILVIMALSIVYGGYALFINPNPNKAPITASSSKLDAFNEFISKVSAMTQDGLSEIDAYVIQHIPVEWTKDPLLNSRRDFDFKTDRETEDQLTQSLALSYTGFVEMGPDKLAVIDGVEYEAGESLPQTDLVVEDIDSNRVVIFVKTSKKRVSVPLEEIR